MKSLLFLLALSASAQAAPKTICTATINSNDEREVFKKQLNPNDFKFVELTEFAVDKNNSNQWFEKACEAKVECDVLIISGHFGGTFFGSSKFSLGLNDLERNSCQRRCAGILEKPKEVFLFGCNTLASKEKDHRTPQEYLQALLEHNPDLNRPEAERIVAARYSPIGSSNNDRMERIFENVPLIYGFSSVGPSGTNVRSSLQKYLKEIGDYKKHLENIENGQRDTAIYLRNMTAYKTAISQGLKKDDPGYDVKQNTCEINNYEKSTAERIDLSMRLLEKEPFLYFPTVAHFISNNFSKEQVRIGKQDPEIQEKLKEFTSKVELKKQMTELANLQGLGVSLQLDLLKFGYNVGWYTKMEYRKKLRNLLNPLIRTPTIENKDLICSLRYENSLVPVSLENLDFKSNFQNLIGLSIVGCLPTRDSRITEKYIQAAKAHLSSPKISILDRFYILSGLVELPGFENEKRALVRQQPAEIKGQYQKEYKTFIKGLFLATAHESEQMALLDQYYNEYKGNDEGFSSIVSYLAQNKTISPAGDIYLTQYANSTCNQETCSFYYSPRGTSVEYQDWVANNFQSFSETTRRMILYELASRSVKIVSEKFIETLIATFEKEKDKDYTSVSEISTLLANADLSGKYLTLLRDLNKRLATSGKIYYIKHVLYTHRHKIADLKPEEVAGQKMDYKCIRTRYSSSCASGSYE